MTDRLHFSRAAERDLDSIWTYSVRQWGREQANAFIRRLNEAFDRLSMFPLSGRDESDLRPGYRALAVSDYRIFYRLIDSEIEIVRILHGQMDIARHLDPDG